MKDHEYEQITLPLDDLMPDEVALRTDVDKESARWPEFVESIKESGILNPISVRKVDDQFVIIDGMHRYEAAREAGLREIPCIYYKNVEPRDVLDLQIIANAHKIETKPIEYANQLQLILSESNQNDPVPMTQADLAKRIHKSPAWVSQMLKLTKMPADIQELVNDNKIPLANAIYLAKMPPEEQELWVDRAQTMSPDDFTPDAVARISELKKRPSKAGQPQEFTPNAKVRTKTEILDQYYNVKNQIGDLDELEIDTESIEYAKGYYDGLRYSLSLDDKTIAEKKKEYEDRLAEQQERRAAKAREKAANEAAYEGVSKLLNKDGRRPIGAS